MSAAAAKRISERAARLDSLRADGPPSGLKDRTTDGTALEMQEATEAGATRKPTIYEDQEWEQPCCGCCRCCNGLWNSCCCCCCRKCCSCLNWFGYWSGFKCCCCNDHGGKLFLYIEKENRYPTDVPCCLLLLGCLIIQLILISTAIPNADPRWLVLFANSNATLCGPSFGTDNFTSTRAAWPDIRMYDVVICVDDCDETLTDDRIVTPPFHTNILENFTEDGETERLTGYRTVDVLRSYCLPDPRNTSFQIVSFKDDFNAFIKNFDSVRTAIELTVADVSIIWPMLLVAAFVAVSISFLYGVLLRYFADFIVWGSIIFVAVCVAIIGFYFIDFSDWLYTFGYTRLGDICYYSGVLLIILDVMFVLAVLAISNRIRLAIAMSKETTRALQDAYGMLLYPLIPFFVFAGYFAYWLVGLVYMASVTETIEEDYPEGVKVPYYDDGPTLYETLNLNDDSKIKTLQLINRWNYYLWFHLFMLLWIACFITYSTVLVYAGIFAEWYFSRWTDDKESKKMRGSENGEFSNWPVFSSTYRMCRYHLGSVAFASMLIASIEFAQIVLNYFEKKIFGEDPSKVQKILLGMIDCLLDCLEWLIDKINRNGLIIVAIYGWPLCASSGKGLMLIYRNVIRATALELVAGYLERIGQTAIVSVNVVIFVIAINSIYGKSISSLVFPAIIAAVISIVVAWQWLNMFEAGIHTIFMCFLIDEEHNKGGNMVASKRLYKVIGEQQVPREQLLATAQSKRRLFEFVDEERERRETGRIKHKHTKSKTMTLAGAYSLNNEEIIAGLHYDSSADDDEE